MEKISENEFIKGIAEGKYTPNDAVKYCRGCFDKEYFLKNLFVSEIAFVDFPMERQRAFISRAKEAVYYYLIQEGHKLAHNYYCWSIDSSLNKQEAGGTIADNADLPSVNNTDREKKYYARAIELGWMKRTATGYKWLLGGTKGQVRLGYFLSKVIEQPRPIAQLETLFGVKNLAASITNANYPPKRADVKRWRAEIDKDIFFD